LDFVETEHALSTVAACGGIGWLLDVWIGRSGQHRVRGWLETWWLRFSYVRLRQFGREEALFAVQVIDRLFGQRLFSIRRVLSVVLVAAFAVCVGLVIPVAMIFRNLADVLAFLRLFSVCYILEAGLFAISISLTRLSASKIADLLVWRPRLNFFGIVIICITQYCIMLFLAPLMDLIPATIYAATASEERGSDLLRAIWPSAFDVSLYKGYLPRSLWPEVLPVDLTVEFGEGPSIAIPFSRPPEIMSLTANLGRLLLFLIFALLSCLAPFQHRVLVVWAAIVESDKPVFTFLLGGIAAVAKAIEEIMKSF
jgi:hypothetical protein